MQEPALVSFDKLKLSFCQEMDLLPNPGDKQLIFRCELIGCMINESLIIGPPAATGMLPRLVEGQRVVVRVKLNCGIALFPTTVLFVSEIPTIMVFLDYPRDIKFKQIRSASRVDVALPIIGFNQDDPSFSTVVGKIIDISTVGARLKMFEPLGKPGQKIDIKGKFSVAGLDKTLNIAAIIRSESECDEQYLYGIEFCEDDPNKLLTLHAFTFQEIVFGTAQIIR